jgi:predicted AlkP superfamily phosphohydrolase/phosphomutase
MILVLGIDAATFRVIKPNLERLPNFKRLCELGNPREIVLKEKPASPAIWCGMFCGKTLDEHGHESFTAGDRLVKREDIGVEFIWDILPKEGKTIKAINIPFVVPPYCFGVDFKPVGFGLPTNEKEWQEELDKVTSKTKELLARKPDVLISVYTLLDRIQHFHWGEGCVVDWYQKVDGKIGEILFDSGFLESKESKESQDNRLIVISDHGFCSFGEAKVQTLPQKTAEGEIKGDHDENALLITVNLDDKIERPQDVFFALKKNS